MKARGNHPLRTSRIILTTGDLRAALCNPPGHTQETLIVAPRGEVVLGVETQPPVPMATPGRSVPGSNRQKMHPHRLVGGVGSVQDLETVHLPLLTKVTGEGIGQCPEEVPVPISLLPLPPLVGSWSWLKDPRVHQLLFPPFPPLIPLIPAAQTRSVLPSASLNVHFTSF